MKKIIYFIMIIAIIIVAPLSSISIFSKESKNPINIDSKNAICIDRKTFRVLYEKNAYDITAMASTTKIMTALLAIESGDLNKKLKASSNATSIRGSKIHLRTGEERSLKELIVGLMTKSGNDAAITIAEGLSGTVENYCYRMNEKALRLGLFNTNFITPHGLDRENHYTTVYDLAILSSKAMENKLFREIVGSKHYAETGFVQEYQNINKILWQIPEATGIKTGFTHDAGKCLVTSAMIGDNEVIIVTINSPERWDSTKKIYDYVKENYSWESIDYSKGDIKGVLSNGEVELSPIESIIVPIKVGSTMVAKVNYDENINIKKIKKVSLFGKLSIFEDETLLYEVPLMIDK